jgi:PAS domain S-box-containing protein
MSIDGLALLEALPEPHLLVTTGGRIVAANPAAARVLELPLTPPFRTISDFLLDPPERIESYLAACSGSSAPLPGVLVIRGPCGGHRRYPCSGTRLASDDTPVLVLLRLDPGNESALGFRLLTERIDELTREVQERKRAEAELGQTASRLNAVVLASPLATIGLSRKGVVTVWNPAAERMFGWTAAETIGHPLPILPEDETAEFERIWSVVKSGRPVLAASGRRLRKDGGIMHVSISTAPMLSPDGEFHGSVAVLEDITEKRKAAEALRESEERFRDTFEQAAVGIAHVDLDGRWIRVNERLCEVTGYPREELLRLTFQQITHPADLETDLAHLRRLVSGVIDSYSIEKRYIRKDGGSVWVELTVSLIRASDGTPKYLIGVIEDITARREAQEETQLARAEAEAASRAKSQFLAVMSHELRTPLTGIIGYADILGSGIWGEITEQQREQVSRIKAGAWHLVSVIEEILTFSRSEAGREDLRLELVDVARIAREGAELLEPQAEMKSVALRVRIPDSPVEIMTDGRKVRQIILNLVGNAVKFTDSGEVELSTERSAEWVVFRVRDTGPGIPSDQLERIFEPFTQLDQSHTRIKGGTGLGLTVSRKLAQLLGGDVTVESNPATAGSVFSVRLPCSVVPPSSAEALLPGARDSG